MNTITVTDLAGMEHPILIDVREKASGLPVTCTAPS